MPARDGTMPPWDTNNEIWKGVQSPTAAEAATVLLDYLRTLQLQATALNAPVEQWHKVAHAAVTRFVEIQRASHPTEKHKEGEA